MVRILTVALIGTLGLMGHAPAQADGDTAAATHRSFIAALFEATGTATSQPFGVRSSRRQRRAAAAFLEASFESLGLETSTHDYAYPNGNPVLDLMLPPMRGRNVYATLSATSDSGAYVVVGAHYDSVPGSPGADDNATGVSAVLRIAARVSQLDHRGANVIFVLFDQEEEDKSPGSRAFARHLVEQGYEFHSMHNIDMLGWDGDGDRTVELEVPDGPLLAHYEDAAAARGLTLTRVRYNGSDHIAFRNRGIAAVCIGEEVATGDRSPHYHAAGDTPDTLDYEFLATATLMVGDVLAALAQEL